MRKNKITETRLMIDEAVGKIIKTMKFDDSVIDISIGTNHSACIELILVESGYEEFELLECRELRVFRNEDWDSERYPNVAGYIGTRLDKAINNLNADEYLRYEENEYQRLNNIANPLY